MLNYEAEYRVQFTLHHCWEALRKCAKWNDVEVPNFEDNIRVGLVSKRYKSTGLVHLTQSLGMLVLIWIMMLETTRKMRCKNKDDQKAGTKLKRRRKGRDRQERQQLRMMKHWLGWWSLIWHNRTNVPCKWRWKNALNFRRSKKGSWKWRNI